MTATTIVSPGGTAVAQRLTVTRKITIGVIGTAIGGLLIYGTWQGAKATHFVETSLETTAVNTVVYSVLNPLPEGETGAIMPTFDNGVFVHENPYMATRLSVCTTTGALQPCKQTSGFSNVMSGVVLGGAARWIDLSGSGASPVYGKMLGNNTGSNVATLAHGVTPIILAPRDYTDGLSENYLTFTFTKGTGATTSGLAAATVKFEIVPFATR